MKDIKIIVATHKKYTMPEDTIYMPLQVGKSKSEYIGYQTDDTGDNISDKNAYFSEMTGVYWAWKNLKADYVGICHYRRYFTVAKKIPKTEEEKFKTVLNREEIENLLDKADIILPKKRKYYIEDLYSHYKHTLHIEPLDETGKIIEEKFPEYLDEFNKIHKRTSSHMFNMFIMKREYFDKYCEWLYEILFELEKRIDVTKYDSFHARYVGRVSEILLDVWINKNNLKYEEIKMMDMQKVNWLKKGKAFLSAKFTGKKYEQSF